MALEIVEYQAGSFPGQTNDDVEVMREVTADLMAGVAIADRVAVVTIDELVMAGENVVGYGRGLPANLR